MRHYNLRPEKLVSLEDLFPEQKYCIFALDSILRDFQPNKERLEIQIRLMQIEKTPPKEFLPERDRNGIGLSEFEKNLIGTSMKNELIGKLKKRLEEI